MGITATRFPTSTVRSTPVLRPERQPDTGATALESSMLLLLTPVNPTSNADNDKGKWIQTRSHRGSLSRALRAVSRHAIANPLFGHYDAR